MRENFKAIVRLLKLLQFQNKNFKTKWQVGSGHADSKELLETLKMPETPERSSFQQKTINNLKKETPLRKFRIQPDCQFSVVSIFLNWLYS